MAFVKLDEGAGRVVYDLGEFVWKRPKNQRGEIECENEFWLYHHIDPKYQPLLCPVHEWKEDGVVMVKAEPMTQEQFDQTKETQPCLVELLSYLVDELGMDELDLSLPFNWGFLWGNPVLIDYGHRYFCDLLEEELF